METANPSRNIRPSHMNEREEFLRQPVDRLRQQKLRKVVWILTAVVFGLVVMMRSPYKIPLPEGWSTSWLPAVNATLNTVVAITLVAAVVFIKKGEVRAHRTAMTSALVLSTLFLLVYVSYHFTTVEVKFGGEGVERGIYFTLLITHIVAAAVSFPFILLSFVHAWTRDFASHRRMVRWVFPVWLYVSVTGPLCYWMLRPYY